MAKKKEIDLSKLTPREALSLLSKHKSGHVFNVHSFEGFGSILMGCDLELSTIKERFKSSEHICLAGPSMTSMGHGVAYYWNNRYVFLETDRVKLETIYNKRSLDIDK